MLLAGIYSLLTADAGMQAVLGTSRADGTTGVFPGLAEKQVALPCCVMTQISQKPVTSFGGVNRLQFARLRFSNYAASFLAAKTLAQAVKNALNGLRTTLNEGTEVQFVELVTEFDGVEAALQGNEFATFTDFNVCFVDPD